MNPFWVVAWCASSVMMSTATVTLPSGPFDFSKTMCFDTEYQVVDSSNQLVNFYSNLSSAQRGSVRTFKVNQVFIETNYEVKEST